ncbi:MAG: glycosyltransferase, partial [Desulfobaccales bacterium]
STQYFQSLLEQSKYCNSIKFITNPSVEEARLLLSSCYAALNTTQNEDWGMVPLEANAYGKPVIAVNRGGPTESQVDGVTGYLVAPEPNAFARAMALLAKNEELVWEMGKAARQNALKYDWSAVVEKLDKILYKFITI